MRVGDAGKGVTGSVLPVSTPAASLPPSTELVPPVGPLRIFPTTPTGSVGASVVPSGQVVGERVGSSVGPSPGVPREEPVGLAGGLLDPEPPGEKMTA